MTCADDGSEQLRTLGERAFARGLASLRGVPVDPAVGAEAERAHVRSRKLRDGALRAAIDGVPSDVRDHFVEELLGIAYVDVPDQKLPRDHTPYTASGVAEILHGIDAVGLSEADVLVDLGSGLGKVVLLASMLTGARARGVEIDGALVARSRAAAAALGLSRVTFVEADARDADLTDATVLFLYAPFTGAVLGAVLDRIATHRRRLRICAPALDVPWLHAMAAPRSWMNVYESWSR